MCVYVCVCACFFFFLLVPFFVGYNTHSSSSPWQKKKTTHSAAAPYNEWPQSKVVSCSVLWKGQWSCDVDHSVLSSLCSVRYEVQPGSAVLSISVKL